MWEGRSSLLKVWGGFNQSPLLNHSYEVQQSLQARERDIRGAGGGLHYNMRENVALKKYVLLHLRKESLKPVNCHLPE